MLVDSHSGHSGASNGDDGAPVAAVDQRSNQPVIEHHRNKTKLKACQARAETDRGALTMAKRARRRCCRPRGRKTSHGKIRRR